MISLYENIKKRRIEMGMTQSDLAKKAGYADKSMIAKIEKGQIDLPQSKIMLFAKILQVMPGELMGWETNTDLPPYPNIHPISRRSYPVLGNVSCGEPVFMAEEKDVYIDAENDIKADFVLIAKGDSMIGARIHDGDIVFVRSQPTVENGEIAVVAIDDEATLKRFYRYHDLIVLRAENPAYKDMEFRPEDGKDVRILGKAVAFQSNIK